MSKPLAIDLYAGLGGWTEGLLAEGYRVVGFDVERHVYGEARYPAQLVLQDVLTIHGRQFKDATLIVASPPCQEYSYMAMPWSKAKEKAAALRDGRDDPKRLTALFDACFRIQREACEAAGRHIPLVVENVCGAQKWVGRAKWHFGSFYLWGDVPALMPITKKAKVSGFRFDGSGGSFQSASVEATKVGGFSWSDYGKPDYKAKAFNGETDKRLREEGVKAGDRNKARACGGHKWDTGFDESIKNTGGSWFNVAHNTTSGHSRNPVNDPAKGVKQHGSGPIWFDTGIAKHGSKSTARKAASAHIAKIPLVLSRHIARAWHPDAC